MGEDIDRNLHGRFLRGLAAAPHGGAALRLGDRAVSFAELHETALVWAGSLLRAGVTGPVGVLAEKGTTAYAGVLAALYTGGPVVPLHVDFPPERTARMAAAAGVTAVIADARGAGLLPELRERGYRGEALLPRGGGEGAIPVAAAHAPAEPRAVPPGAPAYTLFTSGSTGRPKGVVLTHANLCHYFGVLDGRYDFGPDDAFSQTFDLTFDCGIFDLFCAWGAGAAAVPVPPRGHADLPAFLERHRVTVWFSTPSGITLARRLGALRPGALPGLRWSFFAGEALRCADVEDWTRAAPYSAVENLYGPTELTVTITGHRWLPDRSAALAVNGVVPIGSVHPGHEILLVTEDGRVTDAEEGELCVTGPQLTPGYLDPADGAGRFLRHAGRTWYRTGDRVRRLPGGELCYLGRRDAQVQVQGWRVELAEIEHALLAVGDGVAEAAAVGVEGAAGTELVVFYTGEARPPVELANRLRRTLPDGMVPKRYHHLGELPLNANRKVDRKALTERAGELLRADNNWS
ncbi:AMP-binding protein [Bailinhaonella thermotolerans]|uniref:D-alanine--poly(Phosphoribitol) ligase n=1 Tax=Bailinhaonella thermotolerans TaxID=1070861 RepID=A0A3A4B0G5_9ACTN|nr:AMP-binding protein [Bailinhaonella thermotolerans]RJL31583.1 D-alanine--poly(phosphoribitol) ligase [Bailinhaonella thermotolerans]